MGLVINTYYIVLVEALNQYPTMKWIFLEKINMSNVYLVKFKTDLTQMTTRAIALEYIKTVQMQRRKSLNSGFW